MTTTFDPADWVERLEALGYTIYYWYSWIQRVGEDWRPKEGCLVGNPRKPAGDAGLALWYELRGDKESAEENEDALDAHLKASGRIVRSPRLASRAAS